MGPPRRVDPAAAVKRLGRELGIENPFIVPLPPGVNLQVQGKALLFIPPPPLEHRPIGKLEIFAVGEAEALLKVRKQLEPGRAIVLMLVEQTVERDGKQAVQQDLAMAQMPTSHMQVLLQAHKRLMSGRKAVLTPFEKEDADGEEAGAEHGGEPGEGLSQEAPEPEADRGGAAEAVGPGAGEEAQGQEPEGEEAPPA
jgi:hypothetical protein